MHRLFAAPVSPTFLAVLVVAFFLTPLPAAAAAAGDAIAGRWKTDDGKAHVRVFRQGETFAGEIVWLGEPLYPSDDPMAGKPRVDRDNPDPDLRSRPILGLRILEGLRHAGDGEWEGGSIYDPENGKTYKCKAWLGEDGDTLHLRGFIGFSLFGRTTGWTRVEAPAEGGGTARR